jgi:hypothetical protein
LVQSRDADFDYWILSREVKRPYYVAGNRFDKAPRETVTIDRGTFDLEEAIELGNIFLSINHVARLSAQLAIWGKNGALIKIVLSWRSFY